MRYIETKSYDVINDIYFVDFFENEGTFESWVYRKGCGIKNYLIGCPVDQQDYKAYIAMVECGLAEDIALYEKDIEKLESIE